MTATVEAVTEAEATVVVVKVTGVTVVVTVVATVVAKVVATVVAATVVAKVVATVVVATVVVVVVTVVVTIAATVVVVVVGIVVEVVLVQTVVGTTPAAADVLPEPSVCGHTQGTHVDTLLVMSLTSTILFSLVESVSLLSVNSCNIKSISIKSFCSTSSILSTASENCSRLVALSTLKLEYAETPTVEGGEGKDRRGEAVEIVTTDEKIGAIV